MNYQFVLLLSVVIFLSVLQQTHSKRILVLTFFSSKSHKITYMGLLEELASRGHEITIVTPIKGKPTKNIREIYTMDVEAIMHGSKDSEMDMFKMKEESRNLNPILMVRFLEDICRQSYDIPEVKDLVNQEFDLVFIQPLFNECVFGIAHRVNAPIVFFFPAGVAGLAVNKLGGHFPTSFVPNTMLGYVGEMNFRQRFFNFGVDLFIEAVIKFFMEPTMEAIYREKLGADIPSVPEIWANASLLLSNGHFSLNGPKPLLPDVIEVGGIHSHPAKPLPKELEDFVSKSGKDGFIFFSMGSAIKGDQMPDDKRKMFLRVFSKLKQQVLWKWESDMPDLPPNVRLSKWAPQQDLLGHKNIKMFITHCGGGSTEEAIYHGVPLIGIPMFADQLMNAQQAENRGYLVNLEWIEMTEASVLAAINTILENPKYRDNVKALSKIFSDQPDHPLQRGVFWVEYVMRHNGAPHLRSPARKLNFIQYHSWDVMAAYLAIICAVIYILFATFRFIFGILCGGLKKPVSATQSKKKN